MDTITISIEEYNRLHMLELREIAEAARKIVWFERDTVLAGAGGFVGAHAIEEWCNLCDALGEPRETQKR